MWRHSQVVRQKSAKLPFPSSNLGVASIKEPVGVLRRRFFPFLDPLGPLLSKMALIWPLGRNLYHFRIIIIHYYVYITPYLPNIDYIHLISTSAWLSLFPAVAYNSKK